MRSNPWHTLCQENRWPETNSWSPIWSCLHGSMQERLACNNQCIQNEASTVSTSQYRHWVSPVLMKSFTCKGASYLEHLLGLRLNQTSTRTRIYDPSQKRQEKHSATCTTPESSWFYVICSIFTGARLEKNSVLLTHLVFSRIFPVSTESQSVYYHVGD